MPTTSSRICLALDGLQLDTALRLTNQVGYLCYAVKIHDAYDDRGARMIRDLKEADAKRVWVDSKIHDTKDTVGLRVKALVRNGADIVTVHASGGVPMMTSAVSAAVNESRDSSAEIWAITVLTSLDDAEIERIYGKGRTREQIVHELALMAKESSAKTVVCSAMEVGMLAQSPILAGMGFTVPGTRSAGVVLGQQKRSGAHPPKQSLTARRISSPVVK